jgi:hypothetical protein
MRTILFTTLLLCAAPASAQMLDAGVFAADVTAEGWTLNGGAGARTHILFIRFVRPFPAVPSVVLSLTSLDGASGTDGNIRVALEAENVSREGFVLKMRTWSDSRITGVGGHWLAVLDGPP